MTKSTRSQSQLNAELEYYEKKRKGGSRSPSFYMNEKESAIVDRVCDNFGSKKEATIEAFKLLDKKLKGEINEKDS